MCESQHSPKKTVVIGEIRKTKKVIDDELGALRKYIMAKELTLGGTEGLDVIPDKIAEIGAIVRRKLEDIEDSIIK